MATLLPDGSLLFNEGEPLPYNLSAYNTNPDNGRHFIPKFLPCLYRVNCCRVCPTNSRLTIQWRCNLFVIDVNVKTCESCNERQGPQ
jgi:hypothetical protein